MVWYGMVGMVEVCEGAPVAWPTHGPVVFKNNDPPALVVSGWVLADRHDLTPCAASSLHRAIVLYTYSSLHRATISVTNITYIIIIIKKCTVNLCIDNIILLIL